MRSCFVLFLFLLPMTLPAQSLQQDLDRILLSAFQPDQPGGALMITRNGEVIFEKAIGLAHLKSGKNLAARSNFRMASVTKQFTAMAILLLEKDGKLSFDDPLTRFFPGFAPIGARMTVRQLLTHTSGIWAYEAVMDESGAEQLSDADVLRLIRDIDKSYFEPGSEFRYSNSAYCLLALIVEEVSGRSFARFLRDRIFNPLGMKNTRVFEAGKRIRNRVYGYARDETGRLVFSDQSLTSATKGDGGVYTSLEDYRKWDQALTDGRLIDLGAAFEKIRSPVSGNKGYYGPGWFFKREPGPGLEMFHSGSTCGFSNMVIRIPDKGVLVAFFSNIAGNHDAFYPVFERLVEEGLLQTDIRAWHQVTD